MSELSSRENSFKGSLWVFQGQCSLDCVFFFFFHMKRTISLKCSHVATLDGDKVHLFLLYYFSSVPQWFLNQLNNFRVKKIYEFGFFPEDPLLKSLLTHADAMCSLSTETSLPLGKGVPRQWLARETAQGVNSRARTIFFVVVFRPTHYILQRCTDFIGNVLTLTKIKFEIVIALLLRVLHVYVCVHAICGLVDCSLPGFSVHGILQARTLEWVAKPSSRGSSQHRNWTRVSGIVGGFSTHWATWEACLGSYCQIFLRLIPISSIKDSLEMDSMSMTK